MCSISCFFFDLKANLISTRIHLYLHHILYKKNKIIFYHFLKAYPLNHAPKGLAESINRRPGRFRNWIWRENLVLFYLSHVISRPCVAGAFLQTASLGKGPASQPQSTLSCWKNLSPLIKYSNPPKLGLKKTESIIAFRIALKIDVKIV